MTWHEFSHIEMWGFTCEIDIFTCESQTCDWVFPHEIPLKFLSSHVETTFSQIFTHVLTWLSSHLTFDLNFPLCHLKFRETTATLTVRVQLVPVGHQPAVVPVIRDAVVVIVVVAGVSLPVLVVVCLVAVGDVGTVVKRVLVAVLIDVLVVVTHVPDQVTVRVELQTHTRMHTQAHTQ